MIRKIFLSMVVIISALVGAHAEETTDNFYINDFSIAPGETKEVNVCLQSTQLYRGFQVNIYLPEGLSFVSYNPSRPNYVRATSRIPSSEDPTDPLWSLKGDFSNESLLVTGYSLYNLDPIEVGDGAVFTFKVKASEDLAGVVYIDLKNSRMTGHEKPYENVSFHGPDTSCKVTVGNTVSLAELIANGDTEKTYSITDLIAVAAIDDGRLLLCKDDNGYANKDVLVNGYIDFMQSASGLKSEVPESYDQSNWVALRLPDGVDVSSSILGCPLKNVVGKLVNTVNPEFELVKEPAANGDKVGYTPNVYIAASFNSTNHQHSNVNGKEYFFVTPKPMEYANIEWAQWNGDKFIAPVHDADHPSWNQAELTGEFEFNGSYLEQGGVDFSYLTKGHGYEMLPAVIKLKDNNNDNLYVMGNVNGMNPGVWNTLKGVQMSTRDGKVYTKTITVDDVENGFGFFSFSKRLGSTWEEIHDFRIGADPRGLGYYDNYPVNDDNFGKPLPLAVNWNDIYSFKVASGTYKLVVTLDGDTKTLVVTKATAQAPSLLDEANKSYVVYPLALNKVTYEDENGVITTIDQYLQAKDVKRVIYFNTLGIESSTPFQGVNIVVTEYTDGTRKSEKAIIKR